MVHPTKTDIGFLHDALLAHYHPLKGVPDELIDDAGRIRPVWHELLASIARTAPDDWEQRLVRGQQYLRDAGVYYRQYSADGPTKRDWPLSAIPLLIDEDEWQSIGASLIQRADLLEHVLADIYGDNHLVRDGFLPSALVTENPEWLRPLVGIQPRSGHFLHFVAFDIGRGPDGQWWVLGDRTQAPSGAGFALENRLATSRIFADIYSPSYVHRLAGFFRQFRNALLALRGSDESRVGILTPGPLNETYFEHAYIARYLGFMLLEGEDMTMRDGRLMVRTVAGLKPLSVLWRRMDAQWTDPLELEESSQLGTAGLLGAIRGQNLTMVNALGSGILETRALMAFLPRIAREWGGEPLAMPNIATWWCGQDKERDYVRANAAKMTISKAFATRFLFDEDDRSATDKHQNGLTHDWQNKPSQDYVGQEAVTLSTTPALVEGKIVPRPMSLRVFLARSEQGWHVMPGGFARIGLSASSNALAMQDGGAAADVWIVSQKPVEAETMLQPETAPFIRRQPSILPSRAADNLFWLGRYTERTEHLIRLLRAYHLRLAESDAQNVPLLDFVRDLLEARGVSDIDKRLPFAISASIRSAGTAASHITDRFSMDGHMALADLAKTIEKMGFTAKPGVDMAQAMSILLRKLSGFSGLVHDNMTRFMSWRFLSIGKSLERAITTTQLIRELTAPDAPYGALDFAIEVADSAMTHRRRYEVSTNQATVVDLLALDPLNPRSILYQLDDMAVHVGFLPGSEVHQSITPLQSILLKVQSSLAVPSPHALQAEQWDQIASQLASLSHDLTALYLR